MKRQFPDDIVTPVVLIWPRLGIDGPDTVDPELLSSECDHANSPPAKLPILIHRSGEHPCLHCGRPVEPCHRCGHCGYQASM